MIFTFWPSHMPGKMELWMNMERQMNNLQILIDNPKIRSVFGAVSKNRMINVRDLRDLVEQSKDVSAEDSTTEIIKQLKDAKLVDVQKSSISDFDMVYLTADGLDANRRIKRLTL